MAEFRIVPEQVNHAAQNVFKVQNDLNRIYSVLQEAYMSARGAWSCATADHFFGQLSKALQAYPTVVSAIANTGQIMQNASGNYLANEEDEKRTTKSIMDAYS